MGGFERRTLRGIICSRRCRCLAVQVIKPCAAGITSASVAWSAIQTSPTGRWLSVITEVLIVVDAPLTSLLAGESHNGLYQLVVGQVPEKERQLRTCHEVASVRLLHADVAHYVCGDRRRVGRLAGRGSGEVGQRGRTSRLVPRVAGLLRRQTVVGLSPVERLGTLPLAQCRSCR